MCRHGYGEQSMVHSSGFMELDPILEGACGNTMQAIEECSTSGDENDVIEDENNVPGDWDNAPEDAGADAEGAEMGVTQGEWEADDDERYDDDKLVKWGSHILERRRRSVPGSIYDMEVELRLPFHMEKIATQGEMDEGIRYEGASVKTRRRSLVPG